MPTTTWRSRRRLPPSSPFAPPSLTLCGSVARAWPARLHVGRPLVVLQVHVLRVLLVLQRSGAAAAWCPGPPGSGGRHSASRGTRQLVCRLRRKQRA
jgi:hypothetical protein